MSWSCEKKSLTSVMLFLCAAFLTAFFNACSESALDADVEEQDEVTLFLEDESSSSVMSSSSKAKSSSSKKSSTSKSSSSKVVVSSSSVKASSSSNAESSSSAMKYPESFKPDDAEYPYADIPRIVIETEYRQAVKDRETEIPAKLQIWGENSAQSEILNLTIKGRGNTSWSMPKKDYKIEFSKKQSMLGMPKDKDWALIANYSDKTLLKNYLMYKLSAKLGAFYAPRCEFVELYLNGEYLGVYLLTETIKIAENRINMPKTSGSYIAEMKRNYRVGQQVIFSHVLKQDSIGQPFRIHYPSAASEEELQIIQEHIEIFEEYLKSVESQKDNEMAKWINIDEYIKNYWVQEFSKNPDAGSYSSIYFTWEKGNVIKMGPVWDFDLSFGGHSNDDVNLTEKWHVKNGYWNKMVFKDSEMESLRRQYWNSNEDIFYSTLNVVDSMYSFLQKSAGNNFKKWDILQSVGPYFHRYAYSSYKEAIDDLKRWINERINWINKVVN